MKAGKFFGIIKCAAKDFSADSAPRLGASVAFYTIFSLSPLIMLTVAVATWWFGAEAARGEIFAQLNGLVGEQGAAAIQGILAATHRAGGSGIAAMIAFGILIVGATSAFAELKSSLDDIWQAPPPIGAGWKKLLQIGRAHV